MSAYGAVLSARFRTLLQYRAAALAGFGTQLFWGMIRLMIFQAFYASSSAPMPMSLRETTTYIWLGQALLVMIPWNVDADVRAMIRSGTVAYELLRPLDLYNLWFCRAVALRTAPALLRCVPMFVVAGLWFGLEPPPSWASVAAWLLTTFGALLLSCALTTLLGITLLWTLAGEGINRLMGGLLIIFTGLVVPLPFFPDWAQSVLNFLPFRGIMDAPFRVYMGHIPPAQAGAVFAHQAAWTLAFVLLGRWTLARGIRRLVIQGG